MVAISVPPSNRPIVRVWVSSRNQAVTEKLGPHHFHILSALGSLHGIPDAPAEVGHYETVKIPFFLQNLTEQIFMMAALYAVVTVIGAHDAGRPGIHAIMMPHAQKGIEYVKNHPEDRAKDLLQAFSDDSIDMILCAIGGDEFMKKMQIFPF